MSPASWNCRHGSGRRDDLSGGAGSHAVFGVALPSLPERTASTAFREGDPCGKRPGPAMVEDRLFSVGGQARLYIARQNSRPPPSFASLRPSASTYALQASVDETLRVQDRPPAAFRRHEGRDGRGRSDEGQYHDDRTRRHRLRTAARLIPDRSNPRRTPASRLSTLPGRTRPETSARSGGRRRRRLRHLRRPCRGAHRHAPGTRP